MKMTKSENENGFIGHLTELRKRLIHSFIFLFVFLFTNSHFYYISLFYFKTLSHHSSIVFLTIEKFFLPSLSLLDQVKVGFQTLVFHRF